METGELIKSTTNFYGASLSKSVFAVLVMKLVEERILDLDKPLQEYLPKPIYVDEPQTKWHDDLMEMCTYHGIGIIIFHTIIFKIDVW